MKRLFVAVVAALLGALAGSAARQLVIRKLTSDGGEIVIAAGPVPIVAGTVAGLILPNRGPLVAFVVAANVAANTKTGIESTGSDPSDE